MPIIRSRNTYASLRIPRTQPPIKPLHSAGRFLSLCCFHFGWLTVVGMMIFGKHFSHQMMHPSTHLSTNCCLNWVAKPLCYRSVSSPHTNQPAELNWGGNFPSQSRFWPGSASSEAQPIETSIRLVWIHICANCTESANRIPSDGACFCHWLPWWWW